MSIQPPRLPPDQVRVIRSFRLKPETAQSIAEMAQDMDMSQGAIVDEIVRHYTLTCELGQKLMRETQ